MTKMMPKWKPAIVGDKPIRYHFNLAFYVHPDRKVQIQKNKEILSKTK